jgi:hypothetical protein
LSKRWKKPAGKDDAKTTSRRKKVDPTFTVRESKKDQTPYLNIYGDVNNRSATLLLYPSKFEGQFVALALNGYRGGMIPIKSDNIQVDQENGVLELDLGWLQIRAQGKNIDELLEFLDHAETMPREAGGFGKKETKKPSKWSSRRE